MAVTLTTDDLTPWLPNIGDELAEAMIADALALAARVAPCILGDTLPDSDVAAVKAVVRGAILRWHDSGNGAYVQQQAGQYQLTTDNRQTRRSLFFKSEINELQAICGTQRAGSAFTIDTTPVPEVGS